MLSELSSFVQLWDGFDVNMGNMWCIHIFILKHTEFDRKGMSSL
jgi:hypothetical protein